MNIGQLKIEHFFEDPLSSNSTATIISPLVKENM